MTIEDALSSGIGRGDSEILLAALLHTNRTWVLAHPEHTLNAEEEQAMRAAFARRKSGEPVAYITGRKEFYGRDFLVTPDVLIPRPSTERLAEIAIRMLRDHDVPPVTPIDARIVAWADVWGELRDVRTIADVGTGSGCIAVTLAHELPMLRVIATDISEAALVVAKENAQRLGAEHRVHFVRGAGLEPLRTIAEPFLIISNPPYIPENTDVPADVGSFEPGEALFAGPEGTDVIEDIVRGAKNHPNCIGFVMECREEQVTSDLASER